MIKILFVCHGNILKNSGKACKINGFAERKGAYYTTTTPLLKEPWDDIEMGNDEMAVSNRKKAAIFFYRKMCRIYTDIIKSEEGK